MKGGAAEQVVVIGEFSELSVSFLSRLGDRPPQRRNVTVCAVLQPPHSSISSRVSPSAFTDPVP